MHLFGLNYQRVTYPYNNVQQVLTANRPSHVVTELLR
jgi:hypothetical protein